MSFPKEYWNNEHLKYPAKRPAYDLWLDRYKNTLEKSMETPIVDLGCGCGNNSLYLVERGYKVISCDISEVAVKRVETYVPEAVTMVINMLDGLPLESDSANVVITDLSLHYFSWNDTLMILQDIKRVLKPGGHLFCRVNSTKDVNYGAGQGIEAEENYYEVNGNYKRFFDRKSLEKLFNRWNISYISEYEMCRYKLPKVVWEVAATGK